ncbi:MAG: TPM domain-containing protein [Culturomica sp.]|jgi:uncharacterized membrane protein|nr:TPM domain-containing protein [Culturomica sp.]
MSPEKQITAGQRKEMVAAIREAEQGTSGEIRVHIAGHCKENILDGASRTFARLKMHKTALRNGVLIYVALQDRQLAIIGDAGINSTVPAGFWDGIKEQMVEQFRQGRVSEGICEAIRRVGEQLKIHFPRGEEDKNELPDEISFG